MKKVFAITLIALSSLTHAGVVKSTCSGTLQGPNYSVDVNWKLAVENQEMTVSEGHIKMVGQVENGVALVRSDENSESMEMIEIDDKHIQVKGQTSTASISGVLTCK